MGLWVAAHAAGAGGPDGCGPYAPSSRAGPVWLPPRPGSIVEGPSS